MRKIVFIFLLVISGITCNKEKLEEQTGLLKDYTGMLAGCGFIIELDNGAKLEPASNNSGVIFENNRRIAVKYRDNPSMSVCMMGQAVEIVSLRYL